MSATIPQGWHECRLENCVEVLDSLRVPVNNEERQSRIEGKTVEQLYPYYGATGKVGVIDDFLFDEELVALGEDGVPFLDPIKQKAYMLHGKAWVNNHAHVLRGVDGVAVNKFIFYYLNQFNYQGYVNGGTRLKLTQASMRTIPIALPPLAEQVRIAAKLEELLAHVDTLKARIDGIPALLKRFRQSVLDSAVSGRLTEDWRGKDADFNLTTIGKVCAVSTGKTPKRGQAEYWEDGDIPWITSALTGTKFCSEPEQFVTNLALKECTLKLYQPGTLLMAMYGEGKTRGQVTELKIEATCNQACAAISVNETLVKKDFVKIRLQENYENVRKQAVGGAQPNLNLEKVREITICLPSMEEQTEIVRRVEQLFTLADQLETKVALAKSRINYLTQSILAKAFRGELVTQDPSDEPANVLLERTQAQRANAPRAKRGRKSK